MNGFCLSRRLVRGVCLAAGLVLLGCSGGENKKILVDVVTATLVQDLTQLPSDPVVFFDNVQAFGDAITLDIVLKDATNTLETDSLDLALWYDATFIQIVSLSSSHSASNSTLFENTCNTIDARCNLANPICLNNRAASNNGGQGFCRTDDTTPCLNDTACTAVGDVCGSYGTLQASFVVVTGNPVCQNDPARTCTTDVDCQFCSNDVGRACLTNTDCQFCSNDPNQTCAVDADCGLGNTCNLGACQGNCLGTGCVSAMVNDSDGKERIATLTFRVREEGRSGIRFVISPTDPNGLGSFVREDLVNLSVQFYPTIDFTSAPGTILKTGSITVLGTIS